MAASQIEKISRALSRYYKYLHRDDYDNYFSVYCEENGLEDDDMDDEFEADAEDAMIIDFDDDFPFKTEPKNRAQAIFDILKKCRDNPDISFDKSTALPEFDERFFEVTKRDEEDTKKIYRQQCPIIWNSGISSDQNFIFILTVGIKSQLDYLLHLADDYARDRVKHIDSARGWTVEHWADKHKHFSELKKRTKSDYKVLGAVKGFGVRIVPKLLLNNMSVINDSLKATVFLINSSIKFISELSRGRSCCPFQVDVCVAVAPSVVEPNVSVDDDDEYDDEDDDDDDDTCDVKRSDFVDYVGNIRDKLEKNKLNYIVRQHDFPHNNLQRGYHMFNDSYRAFKDGIKYSDDHQNGYLFRKRLIIFIDRRTEKDKDKVNMYMYEPPKNCQQIPSNQVPEWCMSASRTCLLPNMDYGDGKDAISGHTRPYQEEKKKEDANIGAGDHVKGGLLTFSFFAKAANVIKCYLYWNGQILRFFPDDIKIVLPKLFNMSREDNRNYIRYDKELDEMIKEMNEKLVDNEFKAFQDHCS